MTCQYSAKHLKRIFPVLLCLMLGLPALCQSSSSAGVKGIVQDITDASIPHALVKLIDTDTGTQSTTTSNNDGYFSLPNVLPGHYRLQIECHGFDSTRITGMTLNVGDNKYVVVHMKVGGAQTTVTVNASGQTINTTDAAVGTVIDRQFVDTIPMNGRSFQTLVLLSPGVVTNSPQTPSSGGGGESGEYSVNGMRSDANNYSVDGASASNVAAGNSGGGSAGMLPSATALGTTQAMLSIDSMQEFRIATSTYSAEYGRQPGAQVSFSSRAGTNLYHGSLYDYLRNSVFDANNWFNTYSTPPIPTPAERQNDFGGTLGGPFGVPKLFSGRDRVFFFFSYEGLRLDQPGAAGITYVPSNGTYNNATYTNPQYANLRLNAPSVLQPVLNAFPLPNCDAAIDPQCIDYGLGGSPYLYSPKTRGIIDTVNARIDYQLLPTVRIFARYQDATSNKNTLTPLYISQINSRNRVYLVGVNNSFGGHIANELRLQYAPALYHTTDTPTSSGGAAPYNLYAANGLPSGVGEQEILIYLPNGAGMIQQSYGSKQFQSNATDAVTWTHGKHFFKAGVDYRQTTAYYGAGNYSRGPYTAFAFTTAASILANAAPSITATNYVRTDPTTKNLGLYVQDEWRVLPRLSLSLGLRWDLNPPPSESGAPLYTYTGNINNPSSLGLSGPNAPLYNTTYTDFAPRFGMAYVIHNQSGHELVFRGGGGLFYDTIALGNLYGGGNGLGAGKVTYYGGKAAFPLTASQILVPVTIPPQAPYQFAYYPNHDIVPPYSIQWNAALEQAFGTNQTLTMGYVASRGVKLSYFQEYNPSSQNSLFSNFYLYQNGPGSNYDSLQLKFQRQMSRGLQVLVSYTWSHAIDWASTEDYASQFPLQRGSANSDVRHNFTTALVYNLPNSYKHRIEKAILGYWNADLWFVARSAFPYEPTGPAITNPVTGVIENEVLNYNGENPYIYKAGIPGGRQINPAIFSTAPNVNDQGVSIIPVGNAPRNFLRGFGEAQANVSIQRDFPLYEQAKLQFRAEAFNIANHPTFGTINTTCGVSAAGETCNNSIMGQATNTLNAGLGGLSSLYQQGGPRSLQFVLKLQF